MMIRTHIAVAIFAILLFLPFINGVIGKILFTGVALIATLLPDVDAGFSTLGQMKGFRLLQYFVRHRGWIHSWIWPGL